MSEKVNPNNVDHSFTKGILKVSSRVAIIGGLSSTVCLVAGQSVDTNIIYIDVIGMKTQIDIGRGITYTSAPEPLNITRHSRLNLPHPKRGFYYSSNRSELYEVNVETGEETRLFANFEAERIIPSPTGKLVTYVESELGTDTSINRLHIASVDGVTDYVVSPKGLDIPLGANMNSDTAWFSDGLRVVVSLYNRDTERSNFYVHDVVSGNTEQIDLGDVNRQNVVDPIFSPDGKKIVFATVGDNASKKQLYIYSFETGNTEGIMSEPYIWSYGWVQDDSGRILVTSRSRSVASTDAVDINILSRGAQGFYTRETITPPYWLGMDRNSLVTISDGR